MRARANHHSRNQAGTFSLPLNPAGQSAKLAYRIDEAGSATGLSRSTLYGLIASGRLRSIKAAGRRLILADDLRAFLDAQREGT
jgi:excisionase family DNA binding protein